MDACRYPRHLLRGKRHHMLQQQRRSDGEIGVLMRKGQDDLLALVNAVIAQMKADGTLRRLHEKYGLVYAYE